MGIQEKRWWWTKNFNPFIHRTGWCWQSCQTWWIWVPPHLFGLHVILHRTHIPSNHPKVGWVCWCWVTPYQPLLQAPRFCNQQHFAKGIKVLWLYVYSQHLDVSDRTCHVSVPLSCPWPWEVGHPNIEIHLWPSKIGTKNLGTFIATKGSCGGKHGVSKDHVVWAMVVEHAVIAVEFTCQG